MNAAMLAAAKLNNPRRNQYGKYSLVRNGKDTSSFVNKTNNSSQNESPTSSDSKLNGQQRAKSAIWSHLPALNQKARDELAKLKQEEKLKQIEENKTKQEDKKKIEASNSADEDQAIPITSFSNMSTGSSSSSSDDESTDKKKQKIQEPADNTKATKSSSSSLPPLKRIDQDDEDDEDEKPSTTNTASLMVKIKALKQQQELNKSKKTPIIKTSQMGEESKSLIKSSFIGPKLPDSSAAKSKTQALASVKQDSNDKKEENSDEKSPTQETSPSTSDEKAKSSQEEPVSTKTSLIDRNKLNYTKDELAKYDHWFKMSKMYAAANVAASADTGTTPTAENVTTSSTYTQQLVLGSHVDINGSLSANNINNGPETTVIGPTQPNEGILASNTTNPAMDAVQDYQQQALNCKFKN